MPRYTLDTQYYIELLTGRRGAADVLAFVRENAAAIQFHAVVGAELLLGAVSETEVRAIRRRLIDPFKAGRVIVPDLSDYLAAGEALRDMSARRGSHPEFGRRNFWNDVLIAVSCRRRGTVLITADEDHPRIQEVVGHQFVRLEPGD